MSRRAVVVVAGVLATLAAVAACARASGPGAGQSGIVGRVVAGPTCPVERAESPCPPLPARAEVVVEDPGGARVAMTTTGEDGRFEVAVRPGRYRVTARTSEGFRSEASTEVEISEGEVARVTLTLDTGIRGPAG